MISTCGAGIAVCLLDKETAAEDINLSHNILDTNARDDYYNGVLSFNSLKKFYRFLINKHFIQEWEANKTFSQSLKQASNKTREILNNEVQYQNFIPQIYQKNLVEANKRIHVWHDPKYTNDRIEH